MCRGAPCPQAQGFCPSFSRLPTEKFWTAGPGAADAGAPTRLDLDSMFQSGPGPEGQSRELLDLAAQQSMVSSMWPACCTRGLLANIAVLSGMPRQIDRG